MSNPNLTDLKVDTYKWRQRPINLVAWHESWTHSTKHVCPFLRHPLHICEKTDFESLEQNSLLKVILGVIQKPREQEFGLIWPLPPLLPIMETFT